MFSQAELDAMRATQEAAMPDTADIYRRVYADDGFGGVTIGTPVKVAGPFPARFTQAQVIETPGAAARDLEKEVWTIRFPFDASVQDEDVVFWLERNLALRVTDVKPRSFETAHTVRAEVVKGLSLGVS